MISSSAYHSNHGYVRQLPISGVSITITARDVDRNMIHESRSTAAMKLYKHGTTSLSHNPELPK